uniref:helix-turn-helix domain-containing protein n=1 Tax=Lactiplantibacillus plantarum TaxID=1590 RepID=UPI0038795342
IINNPDANIATNTIDRLCNYLEIDPSNFFEYSPYLITFEYKVGIYDEYDSDPEIAPFALLHVVSGDTEDSFRLIYEPDDYLNSNIATRDYDGFDEIYSCLPLSFKSDIMDILVGGAKKFVIDKSIKLDHEYKSGDTLKLLIRDIGKSYHYKY